MPRGAALEITRWACFQCCFSCKVSLDNSRQKGLQTGKPVQKALRVAGPRDGWWTGRRPRSGPPRAPQDRGTGREPVKGRQVGGDPRPAGRRPWGPPDSGVLSSAPRGAQGHCGSAPHPAFPGAVRKVGSGQHLVQCLKIKSKCLSMNFGSRYMCRGRIYVSQYCVCEVFTRHSPKGGTPLRGCGGGGGGTPPSPELHLTQGRIGTTTIHARGSHTWPVQTTPSVLKVWRTSLPPLPAGTHPRCPRPLRTPPPPLLPGPCPASLPRSPADVPGSGTGFREAPGLSPPGPVSWPCCN